VDVVLDGIRRPPNRICLGYNRFGPILFRASDKPLPVELRRRLTETGQQTMAEGTSEPFGWKLKKFDRSGLGLAFPW
jgi:hypothetical protein